MLENPVVIVGMARTPIGAFQGALSPATAPELGGVAIKEAVKRAGLQPDEVDDVVMGLCLFAGLKQAPARQAAHDAGIPWEAGCTTLSKMCGSGMKATMIAHDNILAGSHQIMVAGGMESMSNAQYLLPKAREGYRLGHRNVLDHMFIDGLEDAYEEGKLMGSFAEDTAEHYQFTRDAQDSYAIESLNRAIAASKDGSFKDEIAPVVIKTKKREDFMSYTSVPFHVSNLTFFIESSNNSFKFTQTFVLRKHMFPDIIYHLPNP